MNKPFDLHRIPQSKVATAPMMSVGAVVGEGGLVQGDTGAPHTTANFY